MAEGLDLCCVTVFMLGAVALGPLYGLCADEARGMRAAGGMCAVGILRGRPHAEVLLVPTSAGTLSLVCFQ